MVTEQLSAARTELDALLEGLDLTGSPPAGLAAVVSWDEEAGARAVLLWESSDTHGVSSTAAVQRSTLDTTHRHVRPEGSGEPPGLVPTAFVDLVVAPASMAVRVRELAGLAEPPEGLVAHVEWTSGPDETTVLMVWETPDARGEWAERVMMPLFESGTLPPTGETMTHPRPVVAWAR